MVTKAIIESVDDIYSVKVRIPILDSGAEFTDATSRENLNDAIICTLPRTTYIPEVGDIVFVAFEDNDNGKPIIIGCLFKENGNTSQINSEINNLKVTSQASFSNQINIGDITYKEIQNLAGLRQNIQATFENIDERLKRLEGNI